MKLTNRFHDTNRLQTIDRIGNIQSKVAIKIVTRTPILAVIHARAILKNVNSSIVCCAWNSNLPWHRSDIRQGTHSRRFHQRNICPDRNQAFSYSGPCKRHALFQTAPRKFYNMDFHMYMDSHYNILNRDQRTLRTNQPKVLDWLVPVESVDL